MALEQFKNAQVHNTTAYLLKRFKIVFEIFYGFPRQRHFTVFKDILKTFWGEGGGVWSSIRTSFSEEPHNIIRRVMKMP